MYFDCESLVRASDVKTVVQCFREQTNHKKRPFLSRLCPQSLLRWNKKNYFVHRFFFTKQAWKCEITPTFHNAYFPLPFSFSWTIRTGSLQKSFILSEGLHSPTPQLFHVINGIATLCSVNSPVTRRTLGSRFLFFKTSFRTRFVEWTFILIPKKRWNCQFLS